MGRSVVLECVQLTQACCMVQDYCKDWAEQLIVSVVLICSESKAPDLMRGDTSATDSHA